MLALLTFAITHSEAVFIDFENCLSPNVINAEPPMPLQFIPLFFDTAFDTSKPSHNLNITIYGNVSGQTTREDYPPPDDPQWSDPNATFGKIPDVYRGPDGDATLTTLFSKFNVLTYTPYVADPTRFCGSLLNTTCPIGPVFDGNRSNPEDWPAFTVAHDFYSTYSFATFAATIRIKLAGPDDRYVACISANITPDLGSKISDALTYIPAAILALVAIATISAAIFSPWGSDDLFRWSSNYGRDEDLLRLVTPGFGDCLQYVQFIVLAGSLGLNYPGYYQPVVSQASWATLLFNQSLVSHGGGSHSLVDGVYNASGTYGLTRLRQLAGMAEDEDVWGGMMVVLFGLTVGVVLICQLGFFIRWIYHQVSKSPEQDLQNKNLPFTVGNVVRIVFNYFLLPIIALSMFQLVVAGQSPVSVVAPAVILLVITFCGAAWIFRLIFTTRPRAHLFDDMPTVLAYGPLYNTYSDEAAPFAFIPVLLTVVRGVAIGAIQPSGIAQLVVLAICEVVLILTLHAFRPFHSMTSMNAYHTFFSSVRLLTVLLSVAFVPSLGVSEAPKGWIGYLILLLHGIVLIFGFFLNAIQTLIEVTARLAGAGGDSRGGLTTVFGVRQLSRRSHQRRSNARSSLNSDAAMLAHSAENDAKSAQLMGGGGTRSRSLSASSTVLLGGAGRAPSDQRMSGGFDQFSQMGDSYSPGMGTPAGGSQSPFSYIAGGSAGPSSRRPTMGTMGTMGTVGSKTLDSTDPYYRPPRPRRATLDPYQPGQKSRASWASVDVSNRPYDGFGDGSDFGGDAGEGSSFSPSRTAPMPAYIRTPREETEQVLGGSAAGSAAASPHKDYAVREADFYYGVTRGPALSSVNAPRRLRTGPADPMGPVSSASGWLRNLFGGKRKDKGKGFEVVRSQRAPPAMMEGMEEEGEEMQSPAHQEPYRDSPDLPPAMDGQRDLFEVPAGDIAAQGSDNSPVAGGVSYDDDDDDDTASSGDPFGGLSRRSSRPRVSDMPPSLAPIEAGGAIEMPSRVGSKASSRAGAPAPVSAGGPYSMGMAGAPAPHIPRKSSRRRSQHEAFLDDANRLSTIPASPGTSPRGSKSFSQAMAGAEEEHQHQQRPQRPQQHLFPPPAAGAAQATTSARLPFGGDPSPSPERPSAASTSAASSVYQGSGASDDSRAAGMDAAAPPRASAERPLSTGVVHQHKAGESIRQGRYGDHANLGRSAEVVGGVSRGSSR
ncbi:hypothetical protein BDY21DRAFT_272586, partial [Lineolata rhizophorae]